MTRLLRAVALGCAWFSMSSGVGCGGDTSRSTSDLDAIALLPRPKSMHVGEASFRLREGTLLCADADARDEAVKLAEAFGAAGLTVAVVDAEHAGCSRAVQLRIDRSLAGSAGAEAYRLSVGPARIELSGADAAGLFYAGQTLRQLVQPSLFADAGHASGVYRVPSVEIEDAPAFPWRGAMLDVARHFMAIDELLLFVDRMALHKLNRLHWHLTDDQGWRLPVRSRPELTQVGAWRDGTEVRLHPDLGFINVAVSQFQGRQTDGVPHGGSYTEDEIRRLVAFAAERHVVIIPEIDVPGHSQAAIAARPSLGSLEAPVAVAQVFGIHPSVLNLDEATFDFLDDVLDAVVELFPGPYIHMGGDEVLLDHWQASASVQARMRELGLEHVEEVQPYFMGRMAAAVRARGRRMLGWDEIVDQALDDDVIVTAWRAFGSAAEAARRGHEVINCNFLRLYLDHPQQITPEAEDALRSAGLNFLAPLFTTSLEEVYTYDPVPTGLSALESSRILGGQVQLWSESIRTPEELERHAFPRLSAAAEVFWSRPAVRDLEDFEKRLGVQMQRLGIQPRTRS